MLRAYSRRSDAEAVQIRPSQQGFRPADARCVAPLARWTRIAARAALLPDRLAGRETELTVIMLNAL